MYLTAMSSFDSQIGEQNASTRQSALAISYASATVLGLTLFWMSGLLSYIGVDTLVVSLKGR